MGRQEVQQRYNESPEGRQAWEEHLNAPAMVEIDQNPLSPYYGTTGSAINPDYADGLAGNGAFEGVLNLPDPYLSTSFIPGGDPNATNARVSNYETLGIQGRQLADYYGNTISQEASAVDAERNKRATDILGTAGAGASAISTAGGYSRDVGRAGADTVAGVADNALAMGTGYAGRIDARTGGAVSDIYGTELMRGPENAEQDLLLKAKARSLGNQQALAGTVRGIGPRQNTTMEDALIMSEAARNADLLRAEQERAQQARVQNAAIATADAERSGAIAAAQQRQRAYDQASRGYSTAADFAMGAEADRLAADQSASQFGLQGYSAASNVNSRGGDVTMQGLNTSNNVRRQGSDVTTAGGAGMLGARKLEQAGGMGFENYLTNTYAGALGESGVASGIKARDKAATIGGISTGVATFAQGLRGDDNEPTYGSV